MKKIDYHKPNKSDNKRRADFWLSAGSLLGSSLVGYIMLIVSIVLVWIIIYIKAINSL